MVSDMLRNKCKFAQMAYNSLSDIRHQPSLPVVTFRGIMDGFWRLWDCYFKKYTSFPLGMIQQVNLNEALGFSYAEISLNV